MFMKLKDWSAYIAILSILVVVATGPSFFFHGVSQGGQTLGCPIVGMPAICNMSVQEHISAWQDMFTAIPPVQILLLVALLLATVPIFRYLIHNSPRLLHFRPKERFVLTVDNLREAFSNGVIHSKAY